MDDNHIEIILILFMKMSKSKAFHLQFDCGYEEYNHFIDAAHKLRKLRKKKFSVGCGKRDEIEFLASFLGATFDYEHFTLEI